MSASSSKMLQIARKTGRKTNPKRIPKRKNIIPKTILDPFKVVPFQITIPVAHVTDVEFARSLDMFTDPIVAMPPAGKRAERDAAGPSWSQGRGASDTVRLSTRFFILFG